MKNGLKVILFYLVLIIAIILTVSYLFGDAQTEQKKFSDIAKYTGFSKSKALFWTVTMF